MNKTKRFNIENISPSTRKRITEIFDIMLAELELVIVGNEEPEKVDFIKMPFFFENKQKIILKDVQYVNFILHKYLGNLGIEFKITGFDKQSANASWKKLHEQLKNLSNIIKLNKPLNTGDKIFDLTIVKPMREQNKYIIIVNHRYDLLIIVDRAKTSWSLLYKLANQEKIDSFGYYKSSYDYLNTNKRNKLYTKTGLSLTNILRWNGKFIEPAITLDLITEKTYTQKLNTLEKTT